MSPTLLAQMFGKKESRIKGKKKSRFTNRTARRINPDYRPAVESLEDRTLLTTLPLNVLDQQDISFPFDNAISTTDENTPAIAINPSNPEKLVAVFSMHTPGQPAPPDSQIIAFYSTNGGDDWFQVGGLGGVTDPSSAPDNQQFFLHATDPSVGFDRDENFYLLHSQHTEDNTTGALILLRYDFSGNFPIIEDISSPDQVFGGFGNAIYTWVTDDAALDPKLAIDDTQFSFTDPDTGEMHSQNPFTGNVYVSWFSHDLVPGDHTNNPDQFNPNKILIAASADGGQTFTTQKYVNDSGNGRFNQAERLGSPTLDVSQGQINGLVTPGQVNIAWDDFGVGRNSAPQFDVIEYDRIQDGGIGARFFGEAGQFDGLIIDAVGDDVPVFVDPSQQYFAGTQPISVAVGDFDGDGIDDIVSANSGDGTMSVLLGVGDGTFQFASSTNVGAGPLFVATGLFNNDTIADVALLRSNQNSVFIYLGNGNGTFSGPTTIGVGTNPRSIAIGLVNGDNNLDIVTANRDSDDVTVLLGTGTGAFASAGNFTTGDGPTSVVIGNFDNDSFNDVLTANINEDDQGNNDGVSFLRGDGTGSLAAFVGSPAGNNPDFVATGFLDADVILDLVVLNQGEDTVGILIGNGDGTFQAPTNVAVGENPSAISLADFTGDGNIDIATSNTNEDTVSVLVNDGAGTFAAANPATYAVGDGPAGLATGQFNSADDSRVDLAVANGGLNSFFVSVLLANTQPPNSAGVTELNVDVNFADGRFISVNDLNVKLNVFHGSLNQIQVELLAPQVGGELFRRSVTLFQMQPDGDTGSGISGAHLGRAPNEAFVGTTFDDQAPRNIVDLLPGGGRNTDAPYIGHFRTEFDFFQPLSSLFQGRTLSQLEGTWTLRVTDFTEGGNEATEEDPAAHVVNWSVHFTSGLTPQADFPVVNTDLIGPRTNGSTFTYQDFFPASPDRGIGPTPIIATDNTLGSFSPYQGRIYLAYTDRFVFTDGSIPADQTDIYLFYSDDGGFSWSPGGTRGDGRIVQDIARLDGFSEGGEDLFDDQFVDPTLNGRPQFQPQIVVDPTTGAVVVSWFDAQVDASRSRLAYQHVVSVDGGETFSPSTFVNSPHGAVDAVTGEILDIGPIPINQTDQNNSRDTLFSFGDRQGLAVYDGKVYSIYASNLNGFKPNTLSDDEERAQLDIFVARSQITNGPRIIESDQGPVADDFNSGSFVYNDDVDANGIRLLEGFVVRFDRPVNPATFTPADVTVIYREPDKSITLPGTPIAVSSVEPIDGNVLFGPRQVGGNNNLATTFFVRFTTPQSAPGTYSYSIGPDIQDRVRFIDLEIATSRTLTGSSTPGFRIPMNPPHTGGAGDDFRDSTSDFIDIVAASGELVKDVNVTIDIDHSAIGDLEIFLSSPDGTSVFLTDGIADGETITGDEYNNTKFDDEASDPIDSGVDPFVGSFRPDEALEEFDGLTADGFWRLFIRDTQGNNIGTFVSWSLEIEVGFLTETVALGSSMDQNGDGEDGDGINDAYTIPRPLADPPIPFEVPFDRQTLPLIVPGPHVEFTRLPGQPATPDNLALNSVVNSIDIVFDRDMQASTFTTDDIVRIMGPTGVIAGPFTVTANPDGTDPDPNFPRTFRIGFPAQTVSGTYTVAIGSNILSEGGLALDSDLNAGVDTLFDRPTAGTTTVTFNGGDLPRPIGPQKTFFFPIEVANNFVVQDVTVDLTLTHVNVPDLTATLVHPDGTEIRLFTNVGQQGTENFEGTRFDDNAAIPIQNGAAPFSGSFTPQIPLSNLVGKGSGGIWSLVIRNISTTNTAVLDAWSLNIDRAIPSSGLGETFADQHLAHFRIFTIDPLNDLSRDFWTAVGPAGINNNNTKPFNGPAVGDNAGRIGAIAVDSTDPSGNTVYVAGASGGIWRTDNFLTSEAIGPTYIPLTDLGPSSSMNVGSLALFSRNLDANQTIVFAGTGEGDTLGTDEQRFTSPGVGFLRSLDGGASWTLLDSTVNANSSGNILPINDPGRDHRFVGASVLKVIADPTAAPTGEVIVYAAIRGNAQQSGIWRSVNTGKTWTRIRAGQATDVLLAPNSASETDGTLQRLYAAFQGEGVFQNTSAPSSFSFQLMAGGIGNPLIRDTEFVPPDSIPVNDPEDVPNGDKGRIVLATPALLGNRILDDIYAGFLYALVSTPGGDFDGLYLTKDFGQNWTKVRIPIHDPLFGEGGTSNTLTEDVPSNDESKTDHNLLGDQDEPGLGLGNYAISLTIDPTNPHVVYLGGTDYFGTSQPAGGLIRVDARLLTDPHALIAFDHRDPQGGVTTPDTNPEGSVILKRPNDAVAEDAYGLETRLDTNFVNLIRDPDAPFLVNSTLLVANIQSFTNQGAGVKWIPFDGAQGGTNQHEAISILDPVTGRARLIFGDDNGVYTAVDRGDGVTLTAIGAKILPTGSRNGNLQISQFFYGAVQPSIEAADQANGLFYGNSRSNGLAISSSNALLTGDLEYLARRVPADGMGVATDQTGSGNVYHFEFPSAPFYYQFPVTNEASTDFFLVTQPGAVPISRTFGLLQANNVGNRVPDPQWPFQDGSNFAVNPLNGNQFVMSSQAGRVFRTQDQGRTWFPIGNPEDLDGFYAPALAYGAPEPNAPVNQLDNFIYAGTEGGRIFVTFIGGGTPQGSQWIDLSNGLDGSPVRSIVTNPVRGTHSAYAVTDTGVFFMDDSSVANPAWQNITSNLFTLTHTPFGDPDLEEIKLRFLTSVAADWRDANDTTAPILYVGGLGGVFRSTNGGTNWTIFPNISDDGAPVDGGLLPNTIITDLDLSLGEVLPDNGQLDESSSLNLLVATTYGRGIFAIRLSAAGGSGNVGEAPRIIEATPLSPVGNPQTAPLFPLSEVTVRFANQVNPFTFTTTDIVSFTGPGGRPITPNDVVLVPGGNGVVPNTRFRITFPAQTVDGTYTFIIGPNITDFSGRPMNQNENNILGENPGDRATIQFAINNTDNGRFVTGMYNDLLGRPSDTSGFIFINDIIDAARRAALEESAARFIISDTTRTDLITNEIYQRFLGRNPTAQELNDALQRLAQGVQPEEIIKEVAASVEYFGLAGETDTGFLTFAYNDFFLRAPDAQGLAHFEGALATSEFQIRRAVALTLLESVEARGNQIRAAYQALLGRLPSQAELNAQLAAFAGGGTTEAFLASLVGSGEYFALPAKGNNNNETWVNAATQDILGRAATVAEINGFTNEILGGRSRESIAAQLLASTQYRDNLIDDGFLRILSRAPTGAERTFWRNQFTAGFSQEFFIAELISTDEYFQANDGGATTLPNQDTNWLMAIFNELLGRASDPGGQAFFEQILTDTEEMARFGVTDFFITSIEYRRQFIQAAYQQFLDRAAAPQEELLWENLLSAPSAGPGAPARSEQLQLIVLSSSEFFVNQAGGDDIATNTEWVQAMYQRVLSRAPTAQELNDDLDAIFGAYEDERESMALAIATSVEFRARLVAQTYGDFLLRQPSAFEVGIWLAQFTNGISTEQFKAAVLGSPEYFSNAAKGNGTSLGWVNAVFDDVLNRPPSASEQNDFLNRLGSGTSRDALALELLTGDEAQSILINDLFDDFLGRNATGAEIADFSNQLDQGVTDAQVIAQIMSTVEYFNSPHVFP